MRKAKDRYAWALQFCRARLSTWDYREEISMSHPVVLEARSRFQLSGPSSRRLVSALRKEQHE